MRRLILAVLLIIAILASVLLASHYYPDNFFIKFAQFIWTPDLLTFAVWTIGVVVGSVLLFKLLAFLLQLPSELAAFSARIGRKRSNKKLAQGIAAYASGNYAKAASVLTQTDALDPNLHSAALLLAARCHIRQQSHAEARRLIRQARKGIAEDIALEFLEFEADANEEFPDFIVHKLIQIIDNEPDNMRALDMLIRICTEHDLWKEAGEPLLRKIQDTTSLDKAKRNEILRALLIALLDDAAQKGDVQRIHWLYRKNDSASQNRMQAEYARYLAIAGDTGKAEKMLRPLIEKDWDVHAIECYSDAGISKNPQERLEQMKKWLLMHPSNPHLLAAAGRLYRQCGLHAQASEHFEKSLAKMPDYRVWCEAHSKPQIP